MLRVFAIALLMSSAHAESVEVTVSGVTVTITSGRSYVPHIPYDPAREAEMLQRFEELEAERRRRELDKIQCGISPGDRCLNTRRVN